VIAGLLILQINRLAFTRAETKSGPGLLVRDSLPGFAIPA